MKKIVAAVAFSCIFWGACQGPDDFLVGSWRVVLPAEKLAQINAVFRQNEAEILSTTKVTEDLTDAYGTRDIDTLKSRMLSELKEQYEVSLIRHYHYKFTKDGHLILVHEKNGAEDTLFTYHVDGSDLNFALIDESKAYSESIFEEGSSFNIAHSSNDSLILTMSGGTFADTTYLIKIHEN